MQEFDKKFKKKFVGRPPTCGQLPVSTIVTMAILAIQQRPPPPGGRCRIIELRICRNCKLPYVKFRFFGSWVFELLDFTDTELLSNSLCSLLSLNGRNFTEHFFCWTNARLAFRWWHWFGVRPQYSLAPASIGAARMDASRNRRNANPYEAGTHLKGTIIAFMVFFAFTFSSLFLPFFPLSLFG